MLTNYFRTDGWVKSTQGAAIPGAQIYVCTQPANVVGLPPSPLASIFSDVNGLVPITQPIITDGFGHYDFYAAAGVYTVVVGLSGVIQQVYPDQSVGGASGTQGGGGGTAITLQVNGTLASSQLLQNLVGENSVSVNDAGNGTVQIVGSVFQTNGTTNPTQSKLNLVAGTGITLTPDSLGDVTIASSTTATVSSYMIGPGFTSPAPWNSLTYFYPPGAATPLQLVCTLFTLNSQVEFNKIRVANTAAGDTHCYVGFGLYSGPKSASPGTLLWSAGPNMPQSQGISEYAVTDYTLAPGEYYLAWTTTSAYGNIQVLGYNLYSYAQGNEGLLAPSSLKILGIAANLATTNSPSTYITMPSTLGTISGIPSDSNNYGFPMLVFYK